jgi:hypothetical protein
VDKSVLTDVKGIMGILRKRTEANNCSELDAMDDDKHNSQQVNNGAVDFNYNSRRRKDNDLFNPEIENVKIEQTVENNDS